MRGYLVSDTALNDSDKTISPPGNNVRLKLIRVEYTATATAGNRSLQVRFLDGDGDTFWATTVATAFVASDVMVVNFTANATIVVPVDNGAEGAQNISDIIFNSAWSIQVIDTAAVAAAADDMIVHTTWEG